MPIFSTLTYTYLVKVGPIDTATSGPEGPLHNWLGKLIGILIQPSFVTDNWRITCATLSKGIK
jgi:hypothetical protein